MRSALPLCGRLYRGLIQKGYKVAICEQMEDPSQAKGIVRREVIKVVTPGTVTDASMLDEKKNNYLVSVFAKSICTDLRQ